VEETLEGKIDSLEATDRILTLVHCWLCEEMMEDKEELEQLDLLFDPFLISRDFVEKYQQD
jgi:hypothetical protein